MLSRYYFTCRGLQLAACGLDELLLNVPSIFGFAEFILLVLLVLFTRFFFFSFFFFFQLDNRIPTVFSFSLFFCFGFFSIFLTKILKLCAFLTTSISMISIFLKISTILHFLCFYRSYFHAFFSLLLFFVFSLVLFSLAIQSIFLIPIAMFSFIFTLVLLENNTFSFCSRSPHKALVLVLLLFGSLASPGLPLSCQSFQLLPFLF